MLKVMVMARKGTISGIVRSLRQRSRNASKSRQAPRLMWYPKIMVGYGFEESSSSVVFEADKSSFALGTSRELSCNDGGA
ncbi:hypothetical protein LWI29_014137 [Acer saccharum]|uniref:Uncharacterized protein n=1 Tax=Acer saccharum TaxID=4024 RepID=A0AA39VNS6_ACESA|nr:hypothetical protein LWI29_014137 [Acer saccharum]